MIPEFIYFLNRACVSESSSGAIGEAQDVQVQLRDKDVAFLTAFRV